MKHRVMIAGVPRSGTSLVYETLLHQGVDVGKTHTFISHPFTQLGETMPMCSGPNHDMKIVFLFGDPIDSLISTRLEGLENNHTHWLNCGYDPENTNHEIDIFYEDKLNYFKMFASWYYAMPVSNDVLCLRYETLYENLELLQWFIGAKIKFPPWKERQTNYNKVTEEELDRIKRNYKSMVESINTACDAKMMLKKRWVTK